MTMEKLQYLVKKRESYLSAFHKIIRNINGLNEKVGKETVYLLKENGRQEEYIKEAQAKIEDGKKGLTFLDEQIKINTAQIQKIKDLIEPSMIKKKSE